MNELAQIKRREKERKILQVNLLQMEIQDLTNEIWDLEYKKITWAALAEALPKFPDWEIRLYLRHNFRNMGAKTVDGKLKVGYYKREDFFNEDTNNEFYVLTEIAKKLGI